MKMRKYQKEDWPKWLEMRMGFWPHCTQSRHEEEMALIAAGVPCEPDSLKTDVLFCEDEDGILTGFAELSLRRRLEGFETSPVAYLEGWYVIESLRGRGVGKTIIKAVEQWGRNQGCQELASDTEPENSISIRAHELLGFKRYGVSDEGILFRKRL